MRITILAVMTVFCAAAQAEVVLRCPPFMQGGRNSGAHLTRVMLGGAHLGTHLPDTSTVEPPNDPHAVQPSWTLNPAVRGYHLVCEYGRAAHSTQLRELTQPIEAPVSSCTFNPSTRALTCK